MILTLIAKKDQWKKPVHEKTNVCVYTHTLVHTHKEINNRGVLRSEYKNLYLIWLKENSSVGLQRLDQTTSSLVSLGRFRINSSIPGTILEFKTRG